MEAETNESYDSEDDVKDLEELVERMSKDRACLNADDNQCTSSLDSKRRTFNG